MKGRISSSIVVVVVVVEKVVIVVVVEVVVVIVVVEVVVPEEIDVEKIEIATEKFREVANTCTTPNQRKIDR